jgi:hypothetical protein
LILKRAARDNNTLSAVLREGWDSGFLRVLTRGDPLRASNVHLSCVAHITRRELRSSLTETESANGFANRFLYVCARRYRELPRGGRIDDAQIAAVRRRLGAALVFARDLRERVVDLDQDADRIWHAVYGPLGAVPDTLTGAIIARAEPQVLRLSLVYALADRSDVIRAPHLLAALEVWRYCRDSAMHVFGDRLGDALAEDVYHELQRAPGGLTRSELSDCFSRNVPAARLLGALAELKAAGRAQSRLDPAKDRGRPAERWVLSPGRIGSRGVDFLVLGRKALGATPAAEVAAPALPAGDDLPSGAFVPQHDRPGVCGTCGRGTTTYTYVCDECAGGGV